MNLTIGGKIHHPPFNRHDVFLCGDIRGYKGHTGTPKPYPVSREVNCLNCLDILKSLTTRQMGDSGITFRVSVTVTREGVTNKLPSFYFSSLSTPDILSVEDAITAARTMLHAEELEMMHDVIYDVRAFKLNK